MAITSSIGYAMQVGVAQVPTWARALGGLDYSVRDPASWKVSTAGAGARTVQVAGGGGWGRGITDTSSGGDLVPVPNPASGERWHAIVARRNLSGGGSTTFTYGPAATDARAAITARRTFETGSLVDDDQPLALVRVAKDDPAILELRDVRCWQANGGVIGASDYVRDYLNRPGTQVVIDTDLWTYRVTAGGVAEWLRTPLASADSHQSGGSAIPSVGVPTSPITPVQRPITKTGRDRFFTTVAFGNEYAPGVTFSTPFPTACLSVQVLQVHTDGAVSAANIAVDMVSAAGFRVLYPGGSSVTQRAYLWTARGY